MPGTMRNAFFLAIILINPHKNSEREEFLLYFIDKETRAQRTFFLNF